MSDEKRTGGRGRRQDEPDGGDAETLGHGDTGKDRSGQKSGECFFVHVLTDG